MRTKKEKKKNKKLNIMSFFVCIFIIFFIISMLLVAGEKQQVKQKEVKPQVKPEEVKLQLSDKQIPSSAKFKGIGEVYETDGESHLVKSDEIIPIEDVKLSVEIKEGVTQLYALEKGKYVIINNELYKVSDGGRLQKVDFSGLENSEKVKSEFLKAISKKSSGTQIPYKDIELTTIKDIKGKENFVLLARQEGGEKIDIIFQDGFGEAVTIDKIAKLGVQAGLNPEIATIQAEAYSDWWGGEVSGIQKIEFAKLTDGQMREFKFLKGTESFLRAFPLGRLTSFLARWWRYHIAIGPLPEKCQTQQQTQQPGQPIVLPTPPIMVAKGLEGTKEENNVIIFDAKSSSAGACTKTWSFWAAMKWSPGEGPFLTWTRALWLFLADISATVNAFSLGYGTGEARAERPLKGTKWCELCNWDNYTACTEERCRILGQCVYKSVPDQRQGVCLPAVCAEGYPKIKAINASFMIDATHVNKTVNSTGCPKDKGACAVDAGEVSYNVSSVRIVVETEQYAECRYIVDKKGANFSEMNSIEGDIYMPKTRQFEIDTGPLEPGREHVVYIKCASTCNEHPPGFDYNYVKFKLGEKPDEVPPVIVMVEPDDKMQYISDKLGQATIRIYLDENGYCGYSTKRENFTSVYNDTSCEGTNWTTMCHFGHNPEGWRLDNGTELPKAQFVINSGCTSGQRCVYKDALGQVHYLNYYNCTVCNLTINLSDVFADMFNWTQMGEDLSKFSETCKSDPSTIGCAEFTKYVTEKGIDVSQIKTIGVNKLFSLNFRCKDSKGNKMAVEDIYEYRLLTFPAYNISIISPIRGYRTFEKIIELSVESSRPAKCRYDYALQGARKLEQRYENMTPMDDTLSTSHSTFIENLGRGTYNLSVKCRDLGNMETEANTTFTITQAPAPNVTRMFSEGNDLRLETDVKARCVYSIDENAGCRFSPDKASNFSSGDSYHHIATLVKEWTYYVKCRDIWGDNSWPVDCSIIVKPFELPSI